MIVMLLTLAWAQMPAPAPAGAPGQLPPTSTQELEAPAQDAPPVWGGSAEEGLGRVTALADAGEAVAALELAHSLAETQNLTEPLRAEAQYALGFLAATGEDVRTADDAYGAARALAGPGELRADATYNSGVAWFEEGERWRAQIPEIAEAQGAAAGGPMGVPPVPGGPAGGEEEAPDPLESARASYGTARERFIDRLRVDWRDADTRANLELIQRRLAELDDIEKQRKEEEQEQQEEQDEQQDGENEDESEENESSEDSQDEQDSDSESQDESGSQPPPESNESEEGEPEEQQPEEQDPSSPEEEEPEPPGPEDPADPHEPEELEGEAGSEPQEVHLTREEAQRLLDRLSEIEEAAEALRARMRDSRRVPVKRDW